MEQKPLITFALFAYNQERFIREAVEGALSQTYSPLEIILSDDCSSDRTFEIMKEMASEYQGPHQIILNRNEKNLGIGGHINHVMTKVHGEIIVAAAGDDISFSNRVDEISKLYKNNGGLFFTAFSCYKKIDVDGNEIGDGIYSKDHLNGLNDIYKIIRYGYGVVGATQAWTKSIFDYFGPLIDKVVYEDTVIPVRAALKGKIHFIDKSLVKYRMMNSSWHDFNTVPETIQEQIRRVKLGVGMAGVNIRQMLRDVALTERVDLFPEIKARLAEYSLLVKCTENSHLTFFDIFRSIGAGGRWGYSIRISLKCFFPKAYFWYIRRMVKKRLNPYYN